MNEKTQFITINNPSNDHLSIIEVWLKDEYEKTGEGFYGNWELIEKAYHNQQLLVLVVDSTPVAFLTYRIEELTARIDILEVAPRFRKNGYGRIIMNDFMKNTHESGVLAVDLFCASEESLEFWESVGFEKFPEMPHEKSKIWMYKPIVETAAIVESDLDKEVLELQQSTTTGFSIKTWLVERYEGSNMLNHPIIFPVDDNWNLCWRIGSKIFFNDSIKYFRESNISFGDFLIIRELNRIR
jgi:GNAT superfamily N-acetyltransferase